MNVTVLGESHTSVHTDAARQAAAHGIAVVPLLIHGNHSMPLHDHVRATTDPLQVQWLIRHESDTRHQRRTAELWRLEQQWQTLDPITRKPKTHGDIVQFERDHAPTVVAGLMLGCVGLIGLRVRFAAIDRFQAVFGDIGSVPTITAGFAAGDDDAVVLIYRRDQPLADLDDDAMQAWGDDIELIYGEHTAMPAPGSITQNGDPYLWNAPTTIISDMMTAPPLPAALAAMMTTCAPFTRIGLHDTTTRDTISTLNGCYLNDARPALAALVDAACDPDGPLQLRAATITGDQITLGLPGMTGTSNQLVIGKNGACELESWTDAHPRLRRGQRWALIDGQLRDITSSQTLAPLTIAATISGGAFILDEPDAGDWWWGNGTDTVAMRGEAVVIAANTGVGKTTLAALVMAAWIGARPDALGFSVRSDGRRVLYLAMDRPKQAGRALRRIFTSDQRELLDTHLVVRKGPPPAQITSDPTVWATLAAEHDAGLVIIDGLKDATSELNGDEAGLACNQAMQHVIAAGRELIVLHHLRIGVQSGKPTLDDLYGSTWIPSGAGSVIALQGIAGGDKIKLHHLKSPVDAVGPFDLHLDRQAGTITRIGTRDYAAVLRSHGSNGATARDVATAIYGGEPTDDAVARVKKELDARARSGDFIVVPGKRGGIGGSQPARYVAAGLDDLISHANRQQTSP